jgi:hypothetical protein
MEANRTNFEIKAKAEKSSLMDVEELIADGVLEGNRDHFKAFHCPSRNESSLFFRDQKPIV